HDHILRLLPPFIISRGDVAEFFAKFERVLANAAKSARTPVSTAQRAETPAQPVALAAAR
ncbi:MAG: hypothetical protein KGL02_09810, partial [Acidobacteriota bacterium]|nr:hypothetical protein [Acidobacteriota bacterium]